MAVELYTLAKLEAGKDYGLRWVSAAVTGTEDVYTGLKEVKGAIVGVASDLVDSAEYGATYDIPTQATAGNEGLITLKCWKHTTPDGSDTTPAAATVALTVHALVYGDEN